MFIKQFFADFKTQIENYSVDMAKGYRLDHQLIAIRFLVGTKVFRFFFFAAATQAMGLTGIPV
jgi:hypothetical protein